MDSTVFNQSGVDLLYLRPPAFAGHHQNGTTILTHERGSEEMAGAGVVEFRRNVEFWTDRYRIIGQVYAPTGAGYSWRFSDILNKGDRTFIPVCDVTVFSLNSSEIVWQGDFLALNKNVIVLATHRD